jgi:preprotein translocase subunit SecG
MAIVNIVLSVVDIILAVAIIVLFLVQEGNDKGIGVVAGGSSDSYYSKAKGRTLEEQLKTWTVICCVLFAIVSVVLYLSMVKAW